MSLLMGVGLIDRVIQVLRDYLSVEIDRVDGLAGGDPTPHVPADNYHSWDRPQIVSFPAVTIRLGQFQPREVLSAGFGDRVHGIYGLDVRAHVQIDSGADNAQRLQDLVLRYGNAIVATLCDQHDGLETIADPIRNVQRVTLRAIDWGPTEAQGTGQQTRTVTVGVDVERVEAR